MLKILVIDDEKMILNIVESALMRLGFNVETASDGKEGILKFDKEHFDVVITDICMPFIDGNGVARHIHICRNKNTPVIGITGTPHFVDNDDFNKVIQKPFSIKLLTDSVLSMTGGFSDESAN